MVATLVFFWIGPESFTLWKVEATTSTSWVTSRRKSRKLAALASACGEERDFQLCSAPAVKKLRGTRNWRWSRFPGTRPVTAS